MITHHKFNIRLFCISILELFIKKIIYSHIISFGFIDNCRKLIYCIGLLFFKKKKGSNSYIDNTVHITGWKYISIGNNTIISEYSWINVNKRMPNHLHVQIGNNCFLGKRNFISAGDLVLFGDYCITAIDCKFIGSDHVFTNPLMPYAIMETTCTKRIVIGPNVKFGAGVTVIGDLSIGHGSVIGAGAFITNNIPPFSVAVGNPCHIIKRFSFALYEWIKIDEISSEEMLCLPDEEAYLKLLKERNPSIYIPRQAASRRYGNIL
jgi:acetyltransferase-like isoleucine patch superfamily enzyme